MLLLLSPHHQTLHPYKTTHDIQQRLQLLGRVPRVRVAAWLTKLSQDPTANQTWKRNRNAYARLLLQQVCVGVWGAAEACCCRCGAALTRAAGDGACTHTAARRRPRGAVPHSARRGRPANAASVPDIPVSVEGASRGQCLSATLDATPHPQTTPCCMPAACRQVCLTVTTVPAACHVRDCRRGQRLLAAGAVQRLQQR
jgi:hypothetical protein